MTEQNKQINLAQSLRRLGSIILCLFVVTAPLQISTPAQAFTIGEEKEVGEKLLSIIRNEFELLDDPDITEYISKLGKQTLNLAGPQFFNYHFFVIDNKEFNAFAAPSGLIFIHSGLIEICATEGELVSVLAHEVGHAASRHVADRLKKSKSLNMGTTAMMLAGLIMGAGDISEALIAGSMATSATMSLKFSRQDEEEADRLGYKWMIAQNRDPKEMVTMLKKMRRVSRYRRGRVPTYLLTHPEPELRMGYVEDRIHYDIHRQYPQNDEFEFQRIKYRALTLTKDTHTLLPILLKKTRETHDGGDITMAYYGLSQAYRINRDYQKAIKALNKVMAKYTDRHILQTDLARIHMESGNHAKALQILTEVNKKHPEDLYNTYFLARTLQQSGDEDRAVRIYENLTEKLPTYSQLYYDIGQIRASQGHKGLGHFRLAQYNFYEGNSKSANYHLQQALKILVEGDLKRRQAQELADKMKKLEKM